jgi:hypothetical protein
LGSELLLVQGDSFVVVLEEEEEEEEEEAESAVLASIWTTTVSSTAVTSVMTASLDITESMEELEVFRLTDSSLPSVDVWSSHGSDSC